MENTSYKTCAVAMCNNTTIRTPQKLFIPLPYKTEIRKHWLKLAGRLPNAFHRTTSAYFCEDHFDLPNDMKNYATYQVTGKVGRIFIRSGCLPSKFPGQPISSTSTDYQSIGTQCNKVDIKSEYEEEITSNIISKVPKGTSTGENRCQSTMASDLTAFETNTAEWSGIKVKSEFEEEITSGELKSCENLNSKVPTEEKAQLTIDNNSTDFFQPLAEEGGNLELKMECEEEVISSEKLSINQTQDNCQLAVTSTLIGVCQPIVLKINRPSVKCEFEEKKTASVFMLSDHINTVLSEYGDKYNEEMELKKLDKAIQVDIVHKFRSKGTQTKIQTRSSHTSPIKLAKKPVSTSSFIVKDLKPTVSHICRKRKPAILRSSGKRKL